MDNNFNYKCTLFELLKFLKLQNLLVAFYKDLPNLRNFAIIKIGLIIFIFNNVITKSDFWKQVERIPYLSLLLRHKIQIIFNI